MLLIKFKKINIYSIKKLTNSCRMSIMTLGLSCFG